MSKKYRVTNSVAYEYCELSVGDIVTKVDGVPYDYCELSVGDIVTKVDGSTDDDLYELPKHLHGTGHNASVHDKHLELKERNYAYISKDYLKEIKEK